MPPRRTAGGGGDESAQGFTDLATDERQWFHAFLSQTRSTNTSSSSHSSKSRTHRLELSKGMVTHLANVTIAFSLLWVFMGYAFLSFDVDAASPTAAGRSSDGLASASTRSLLCLYLCQLGLIYDNGLNATGKYIGPGDRLRRLNKGRFVFHGTALPLLALPVTETAVACGLWTPSTEYWVQALVLSWSATEFVRWSFQYPIHHLHMVDLTASPTNQGAYLSGTLAYTAGPRKAWELIVPPVLLVLYELAVGFLVLLGRDHDDGDNVDDDAWRSGLCLVLSGGLTLLTSARMAKHPEMQLYGENLHGALIWAALVLKPTLR